MSVWGGKEHTFFTKKNAENSKSKQARRKETFRKNCTELMKIIM
jgi:hypothetical protein